MPSGPISSSRRESPLLQSARLQTTEGERVLSGNGIEVTNQSGLDAVTDHIQHSMETRLSAGFTQEGSSAPIPFESNQEAKELLSEFSASMATGLFDRSQQAELTEAGQALSDLASLSTAMARSELLLQSFNEGAVPTDRAEVELLMAQVDLVQSLDPLPPAQGSGLLAQATEQVNASMAALPDVSAVASAQGSMRSLEAAPGETPYTNSEQAAFLRESAASLAAVHGDSTAALQRDFQDMANALDSGRDISELKDSAQDKLDTLAGALAQDVVEALRSHAPGLEDLRETVIQSHQAGMEGFLNTAVPDGDELTGGSVSRTALALEAGLGVEDLVENAAGSPLAAEVRELLGESANEFSDDQLSRALGPEVPELAQSMGITPDKVADALEQLQDSAVQEGRDPSQIDAAVALDSLVLQGLAHEGAELEASRAQGLESRDSAETVREEPEPEREMEMDGGGD